MSEENVFYVENADEAMNWAMEKAQLTQGYFLDSLRSPSPHQSSFSLKAKIVDGDHVEHIWLSGVSMDGEGSFFGTVNNEPQHVKNVTLGSKIGVSEENLSDWMIIESGRLIGGYTIRAYRDQMSPGQQEDFDESLGLLIDDGVDYFPHDFQTPEGAILCMEDAFTRGDLDAAVACKDFVREARHMFGRLPDFPIDEEITQKTAETLELSFRSYFEENEMPSFEGIERAFLAREFEDDWTVMVTEVCKLPGGMRTMDKIWVYKVGQEWKVGPPANEDP